MERVLLSDLIEHPNLDGYVRKVAIGRYFRKMDAVLLKRILQLGKLIKLEPDEYLIHEGNRNDSEMFILVEGSLAVTSQSRFIIRMETPGDIVGEMSTISSDPRSADVIAETECLLFTFPEDVFLAEKNSEHPSFYVMLSHILAEKLRITTAQSLLRRSERLHPSRSGRIAVIDENEINQMIMCDVIRTEWQTAELVKGYLPDEFLRSVEREQFDLLVVDVLFPHSYTSTDEAVCALLSRCKEAADSILVVSDFCNSIEKREFLIHYGASELLGKPYSLVEFRNSIHKFQQKYFQERELDYIEQIAETDRLTGLANRRRLDQFLEALVTIYPESKQPFSVVIADVDHFKHYNDRNGHLAGDGVLSRVAAVFVKNVRRGDLAARFGGEEFMMVLPNCPKESAVTVAEKLRSSIDSEPFPFQEYQPSGSVTATFGVATFPQDARNLQGLIKKADDRLYREKRDGRNQVIFD